MTGSQALRSIMLCIGGRKPPEGARAGVGHLKPCCQAQCQSRDWDLHPCPQTRGQTASLRLHPLLSRVEPISMQGEAEKEPRQRGVRKRPWEAMCCITRRWEAANVTTITPYTHAHAIVMTYLFQP